ncbi:hypothetical protein AUQ48_14210 [Kocuria flava]|uniref:DUF885 domain-containing protein n=1 Tax=Kocuria flava TaxID=446860 RepID=A0A2N4T4K3_9MICC|nr:DUF885 domain-containing protein [Kocuria flava]PLC13157.1 hypothetical protein AUQ48_14210 [Kocuria flava]
MTAHLSATTPSGDPVPAGTRHATAVDAVAERWYARTLELDPAQAALHGIRPHETGYRDYGPDGPRAWAEAARDTLAELARTTPADDTDRVTAHALRERLGVGLDLHEAGLTGWEVNNIASPVQEIREVFDGLPRGGAEDWRALAQRLRAVPGAVAGYLRALHQAQARGRSASADQMRTAAGQARGYAAPGGFFDRLARHRRVPEALREEVAAAAAAAREAYSGLADALSGELTVRARGTDAVGPEEYALRLREFLGAVVDPAELYAWGVDHLADIVDEQRRLARRIVPGASVAEAVAFLDADPARRLHGTGALQAWMQELSDAAVDALAGTHFEITAPMRRLECRIAPTHDGGIWYTGPSADFSRPGRMWWSVPEGTELFTTWEQTTTVYHEGVPGHHLQFATALANAAELNLWRRAGLWVSGHGEGWALYAERLMDELGFLEDPGDRMGMLDSQRLRAARVVFDIGFHCGFTVPGELGDALGGARPGAVWSAEDGWRFLRANIVMAEPMLRFEWLRYRGWPGQAPSYKAGQRLWERSREHARAAAGARFRLRDFHTRALRLGSVGLDTLEFALNL